MEVSVGKLELVTNSTTLTDADRRNSALRHALRRHTRNLGVDYACGRTIRGSVVTKCLRGVRLRLPMLRRLRAAGARASNLVATALAPAMVYGSSAVGMRPSELKIVRAIAHAALCEHTVGRSVDLDLMIEKRRRRPSVPRHCRRCLALESGVVGPLGAARPLASHNASRHRECVGGYLPFCCCDRARVGGRSGRVALWFGTSPPPSHCRRTSGSSP